MQLKTSELEGAGGVKLFIREHLPDQDVGPQVLRTFFSVHGLGEHSGRYEHFAEWLVQRGWRVISLDLRGHGRSAGTRTHVATFDEYRHDIAMIWQHFQLDRHPTTLFGHSMGGLIAIRAAQSGTIHPAALVVTSPLLGLKMKVNPLKRLLGSLMVQILPKTRFRNGLDASNMTRDARFAEERRNDPLIVRTVTASWFFAMQREIVLAHRDAEKITIPVLAFRGMADATTDGDQLSTWLTKTRSPSHELVSLPLHVHEVFHESDWCESMERMVQWLDLIGVSPQPSSGSN
jgi:lysophospholipase